MGHSPLVPFNINIISSKRKSQGQHGELQKVTCQSNRGLHSHMVGEK